ncbi:TetR family transcriptional regulator [Novosphingobium sp. UBA1939]|uniref:TetR family transcriptional regulator n=1 Tax=Novosphingobium sp. UBA1939 TaxID=1946982 RepID=UPI0025FDCA51|nr:TetR/AcrR family transcriptional regulator C-terminal domain-containing protein [Novosphingobium sp. UBA1939]
MSNGKRTPKTSGRATKASSVLHDGRRVPRAGRPASPLITRNTAAEAALEIIDRCGLEGLSLQAVAQQMGVRAPSLYHHFRDKEELLVKVARLLLQRINVEQEIWSEDWETRTIELALATYRVTMRHPNAAPLALRFFPRQVVLPAYERTLATCPYPAEHQVVVLEAIERFTFGFTLFAAAAASHHTPPTPELNREQFPFLAAAIDVAPKDEEAAFVEALRVILDGLRFRYGDK